MDAGFCGGVWLGQGLEELPHHPAQAGQRLCQACACQHSSLQGRQHSALHRVSSACCNNSACCLSCCCAWSHEAAAGVLQDLRQLREDIKAKMAEALTELRNMQRLEDQLELSQVGIAVVACLVCTSSACFSLLQRLAE